MSTQDTTIVPRSEAMVTVSDLHVEIASTHVPVVAGISFEIGPGQILGLVGESGSGKSTVGLALLGYARRGLRIADGTVGIAGRNVLSLNAHATRRLRGRLVSYVPQDPGSSLNPAHRVGAQLREVLEIHRSDLGDLDIDDRIDQVLEEVALPKRVLSHFPHQMSGGQQQRIGIAMAFVCRPRMIVLDEPTTGLDVTTQARILDTIRQLTKAYGVSGLYVSHDLPAVGQVATTTAVMYAGRIVERGNTGELFAAPRHPYTCGLLAAAPFPHRAERLEGIEGHPPRPGRWPRGCAFANRCSRAEAACRQELPNLLVSDDGRAVRCIRPVATHAARNATLDERGGNARKAGKGVSVSNLVAGYGGPPVLHDVSFEVPPGVCTAIVGESGSGKTTLARCLAGLHRGWQGDVRLDNEPVAQGAADRTDEQRRRMQYIFQNPYASLNPTMTVAENIEEPLRHFEQLPRTERRQRAIDILDSVALTADFADLLPARLSGGERQRVAVARALVTSPEVLICDEVTSALDVSVQATLIEQLRRLQHTQGLTMIFITHNLALVRSLAQQVVVLDKGLVVECGLAAEVLDAPKHAYTRQLLSDIPDLTGSAPHLAIDAHESPTLDSTRS